MKTMNDGMYIHHIGERVKDHFINARHSVTIICPFINESLLESLVEVSDVKTVVIITSWRPDYLVQGYSNPSLYLCCKAHDWELRINNQIHAKMYLFDEEVLSIGSANLTGAGFGINKKSNVEVMVDLKPSEVELALISEIITCSIEVNDEIYKQVTLWLDAQPKKDKEVIDGYMLIEDGESIESLPRSSTPEEFWKSITDCSYANGDRAAFIDETRFGLCNEDTYEDFIRSMRSRFDSLPVIQDFLHFIDQSSDGRRFGECKSWVRDHYHSADVEECTELTQILYSWIPELYKQYHVWRPNYTHVIYNDNLHGGQRDLL